MTSHRKLLFISLVAVQFLSLNLWALRSSTIDACMGVFDQGLVSRHAKRADLQVVTDDEQTFLRAFETPGVLIGGNKATQLKEINAFLDTHAISSPSQLRALGLAVDGAIITNGTENVFYAQLKSLRGRIMLEKVLALRRNVKGFLDSEATGREELAYIFEAINDPETTTLAAETIEKLFRGNLGRAKTALIEPQLPDLIHELIKQHTQAVNGKIRSRLMKAIYSIYMASPSIFEHHLLDAKAFLQTPVHRPIMRAGREHPDAAGARADILSFISSGSELKLLTPIEVRAYFEATRLFVSSNQANMNGELQPVTSMLRVVETLLQGEAFDPRALSQATRYATAQLAVDRLKARYGFLRTKRSAKERLSLYEQVLQELKAAQQGRSDRLKNGQIEQADIFRKITLQAIDRMNEYDFEGLKELLLGIRALKGASFDMNHYQTPDGQSLLDIAVKLGHSGIVEFLRELSK